MGVYKELEHELTNLYSKQTQIYPDSSDFGIVVSGPDDPICKKIKSLLTDENMAGSLKQVRNEQRSEGFIYVGIVFNIPWEVCEFDRNLTLCSQWVIHYYRDCIRRTSSVCLVESSVQVGSSEIFNS